MPDISGGFTSNNYTNWSDASASDVVTLLQ